MNIEKKRIGKALDLRIKLKPGDKDKVLKQRLDGLPIKTIAFNFGISESYVKMLCNPEQYAKYKKYPQNREKQNEHKRKHRERKRQLAADGII